MTLISVDWSGPKFWCGQSYTEEDGYLSTMQVPLESGGSGMDVDRQSAVSVVVRELLWIFL